MDAEDCVGIDLGIINYIYALLTCVNSDFLSKPVPEWYRRRERGHSTRILIWIARVEKHEGTPMDDSTPHDRNEQLGEETRAVVERQLQQPDLQEVNSAVDRLVNQGHSREKAIDTVGAILLEEMYEMTTEAEPFDRDRYITRVQEL